jgi:hemerythrin superfamily protein
VEHNDNPAPADNPPVGNHPPVGEPPAPGAGTSILDVQWRDHRRLEELMDAYEAPGATAEQRGAAVHALVRESSMHSVGEEQVFYPAIRTVLPDGDQLADRGLIEHQQVKQLLADLQRMGPLDPGFDARAQVMIADLREHIRDEDTDILPRLQQAATPEQLQQMGQALERIKPLSPTRSHPLAPSRPPANRVIVPITTRLDRSRDTVVARLTRGQAMPRLTRRRMRARLLLAVGTAVAAGTALRRLASR